MPLSNPNRSGGPKTKAGKKRSSFNALVTGAYSKYALLPHESQRDFERMYQQMIAEWKPTDFTGEMLTRNLADLFWRKLRLQHVEPLVILDKKGPTTQAIRVYQWISGDAEKCLDLVRSAPDFLSRYTQRDCESLIAHARAARQKFPKFITDIEALKNQFPAIYKWIKLNSINLFANKPDPSMTLDDRLASEALYYESDTFWQERLNFFIELFTKKIEQIKAIQKYNTAIEDEQENRITKNLLANQTARAHTELDRAISKAIGELRQHLFWCESRKTIKVETLDSDEDG